MEGPRLLDNDGEKIGSIEELYLDTDTDRAGVGARQHRAVRDQAVVRAAARGRRRGAGRARCRFDKAHVKGAPEGRARRRALTRRGAQSSTSHYGPGHADRRGPAAARAGAGSAASPPRGTVGRDVSRPDDRRRDDPLRGGAARRHRPSARPAASGCASTSSTERRHRDRPGAQARRSASSVSRSPRPTVDAATDGPAISEEEHEVVLHAEEPRRREARGPEGAHPARQGPVDEEQRGLRDGRARSRSTSTARGTATAADRRSPTGGAGVSRPRR